MTRTAAPAARKVTTFSCGCVHHWLSDGEMLAAAVCAGHTPQPVNFRPAAPVTGLPEWERVLLASVGA